MDHHRGTFGVFKGDPVIMGESHKIWMHAQGGGKGGEAAGGGDGPPSGSSPSYMAICHIILIWNPMTNQATTKILKHELFVFLQP